VNQRRKGTLSSKFSNIEGVVVEVVGTVVVEKAAIMKGTIRRRNSRANEIGVEEDVVEEEEADRIIPTSSATNVINMVTLRRIAALTNVQLW